MKKCLLLMVMGVLIVPSLLAQTISNSVISVGSSSHQTSEGTLDWTVGEAFISTHDINDKMLTEGFHQPYLIECDELTVDAELTCVGSDEFMVTLIINNNDGQEYLVQSNNPDGMSGDIGSQFTDGPFPNNVEYTFTIASKKTPFCTKEVQIQKLDCNNSNLQVVDFQGEILAQGNQLSWLTFGEFQANTVLLSKSNDGLNFDLIHSQTNENNSSFIDTDASIGMTFYRLESLDANGNVVDAKALKLIRIEEMSELSYTVEAYPNPVIDELNIYLENYNQDKVLVSLYTITGKNLLSEELDVNANLVKINMRELGIATYLISVATPQGELIDTKKIQKLD